MRKLLTLVLLFSASAQAETWIKTSDGNLPGKIDQAYKTEAACGVGCVEISDVADIEVAEIQGKKAVFSAQKFAARETARAAADQAATAAREARKALLRDAKNANTVAKLQAVVKALVEELKADQ